MPNPFNNNKNNINNFSQINPQMNILNLIQHPDMILKQLNPQIAQLIQNGANPEQLVRNICQQRGIDINTLLQQVNNIMPR